MAEEIKPIMRKYGVKFDYRSEGNMFKVSPDNLGAHSTCITCVYFKEKDETCERYRARPPARVIAFGCKDYNDNSDIPF